MKKLFLILIVVIALSSISHAQEIAVNEARKNIVKYKITSLNIDNENKTAVVNLVLIDEDGNVAGGTNAVFENRPAIIDENGVEVTPANTSYDDFVKDIGLKSAILKNKVKTKLGK